MDLTAMRPICCSAFASKSLLGLSWQQWECRTLRTPSQKSPWPAFFPGSAGFPGSGNFLGPPPPRLENVVAGKKKRFWLERFWLEKKKGPALRPPILGFRDISSQLPGWTWLAPKNWQKQIQLNFGQGFARSKPPNLSKTFLIPLSKLYAILC